MKPKIANESSGMDVCITGHSIYNSLDMIVDLLVWVALPLATNEPFVSAIAKSRGPSTAMIALV